MKPKHLKSVKAAKKKKVKDEKAAELPKDLQDMIISLKCIVQTRGLLLCGHFQLHDAGRINQSIQFLEVLHQQLLADAKAHPSAHLCEELKEPKETTKEVLTTESAETQAEVQ